MTKDYPFFIPHKGKLVGTEECLFKKSILVLGDSHHCGDCSIAECQTHENKSCKNFTIDVINDHIEGNDNPKNAFYEFEKLFFSGSSFNRKKFWESLSFYNYLQLAVPKSCTDSKQYFDDYSENSLWIVLEDIHPDAMIVWGTRKDNNGLYEYLPGDFKDGKWVKYRSIRVNNENVFINAIKLGDGHLVKVLPIHHPSSLNQHHKYEYFSKQINAFLNII